MAGPAHARLVGGTSAGQRPGLSLEKLAVARSIYSGRENDVATIARVVGVSRASVYRALQMNRGVERSLSAIVGDKRRLARAPCRIKSSTGFFISLGKTDGVRRWRLAWCNCRIEEGHEVLDLRKQVSDCCLLTQEWFKCQRHIEAPRVLEQPLLPRCMQWCESVRQALPTPGLRRLHLGPKG
jgi:hypothetical protein